MDIKAILKRVAFFVFNGILDESASEMAIFVD